MTRGDERGETVRRGHHLMRNRLDSIELTHAARTSVHASAPPHAWLAVAHFLVAQMASLVAVPLTVPLRLAMIGA